MKVPGVAQIGQRRTGARPQTALAVLVLVAWCAAAPAHAAPARSPSPAVVAHRLAREVTSARTAGGRYGALLKVMRALRVGVYRPNGAAEVRGAERGWQDLYAYDFELRRVVAAELAAHYSASVADVAGQLDAIAGQLQMRAIDASRLTGALVREARWAAAHPTSSGALGMLLVRALGAEHGYDLLRAPPVARITLDALQVWLIRADVSASLIQALQRRHGSAAARAAAACGAPPGHARAVASNACTWLRQHAREEYETGKLGKDIYEWGEEIVHHQVPLDVAKDLAIGAAHFFAINDGLRSSVDPLMQGGTTHYGHGGGTGTATGVPGAKLRFGVDVTMSLDLPDVVVDCGWMAEAELPRAGAVEDVRVDWTVEPRAPGMELGNHGLLAQAIGSPTPEGTGGPLASVTNGEGLSAWEFTPKSEPLPGVGTEASAGGWMVATVDAYGTFGAKVGAVLAKLFSDQRLRFVHRLPYAVFYHAARGYRFDSTITVYPGGRAEQIGSSGQVCGQDPWHTPWTFARSIDARRASSGQMSWEGARSTSSSPPTRRAATSTTTGSRRWA